MTDNWPGFIGRTVPFRFAIQETALEVRFPSRLISEAIFQQSYVFPEIVIVFLHPDVDLHDLLVETNLQKKPRTNRS